MTRYRQDEKRQQQIEKIAKGTARDVRTNFIKKNF